MKGPEEYELAVRKRTTVSATLAMNLVGDENYGMMMANGKSHYLLFHTDFICLQCTLENRKAFQ